MVSVSKEGLKGNDDYSDDALFFHKNDNDTIPLNFLSDGPLDIVLTDDWTFSKPQRGLH